MRFCFGYMGVWFCLFSLFRVFQGLFSVLPYSAGGALLPCVNGGLGMRKGLGNMFLMLSGIGDTSSKNA